MDLNGWLTVITVFTAIFALIPRPELLLSFYRIKSIEKWTVFIVVIFVIPFIILFPKLTDAFEFLNIFYVQWGFEPSIVAFAIFYLSLLWIIAHLFVIKPEITNNKKSIPYLLQLLDEKPFEEFFNIFTKYTSKVGIKTNWILYKKIFFKPKFLKNMTSDKVNYFLPFWGKISNEDKFKEVFFLFLEDENSVYYSEIKEHWNSYSLVSGKPFLKKVLDKSLKNSINNGLLLVISDFMNAHMHMEHGKIGIYNKPHNYPRLRGEEGFDLPLYYHLLFIGILYATAIKNKFDIAEYPVRYSHMYSIYSGVFESMIKNIDIEKNDSAGEYPTNYHWLISQSLSFVGNWLVTFSEKEYFVEGSSYVNFIPSVFSMCMDELYKGFVKDKISQDFINNILYYNMLSSYFDYDIDVSIMASIEENVIQKIPRKHIKPVLSFMLNEKFALQYQDLIGGSYRGLSKEESLALNRFREFLLEKGMI
jgi:hypothetical protein